MRVACAFTTSVCYLMISFCMTEAVRGSKSWAEHHSDNTEPSIHAFQHELMSESNDNTDQNDDDDDNGKELLAFAQDDDGNNDGDNNNDANGFAVLDNDGDNGDDAIGEENGEPPQSYIQEIRQHQNMKDSDELAQANYVSNKLIYHGQRIALQWKFYSYYWLDCGSYRHNLCVRSTCPRMNFDSRDHRRCYNLLFYIYRFRGRGYVANGDVVALYIPRRKQWFGCSGRNCGRYPCPGNANYNYGFQSQKKWSRCWGEVFRIYARNKGIGAAITDNDQVALYYVANRSWVQIGGRTFSKSRCIGTSRPPHQTRFETCSRSAFQIHRI